MGSRRTVRLASLTTTWTLPLLVAAAVLACSAPAAAGPSGAAGGPSGAAGASAGASAAQSQLPGAGSPAGASAPASTPFVLPSIDLSEGTPQPLGAGTYTVTLTGPWPGAGSYSGAGAILCSSVPGSNQWTVASNFPSGGVNEIGVLQQPGHRSIIVSTPANQENSAWHADETFPGTSVSITGTPSGANVVIHATGRWSDMGGSYSIDLTVTCTPLP